ncbi:type II toxin-antitoxin system HicB family antitoxin [Stenomitos frigidus]|nr:type II toxin-antitoxin system HicB family antitoxin [Stenomitos frigidus]
MQPCTYGKTYEESIANAQEAIAGDLEYCQKEGIAPPQPTPVNVSTANSVNFLVAAN